MSSDMDATIYKLRWQIEMRSRQWNQTFRRKYFSATMKKL